MSDPVMAFLGLMIIATVVAFGSFWVDYQDRKEWEREHPDPDDWFWCDHQDGQS